MPGSRHACDDTADAGMAPGTRLFVECGGFDAALAAVCSESKPRGNHYARKSQEGAKRLTHHDTHVSLLASLVLLVYSVYP